MNSIYEISVRTIDGKETTLATYKGKKCLIVNVASECGFTKQYVGLEKLYQDYKDQNLVILAFPCNQFGRQEPGSEAEIKNFCETKYAISFPLFAKIEINGDEAHPLYVFLKKRAKGVGGTEWIKWNFTKFLVSEEGEVVKRYAPTTTPEQIAVDLRAMNYV